MTERRFARRVLWGLAVLLACTSALPAGGDYSSVPFGLRMPPTFIRFREVSTVGGETVANPWSSAINPASTDWFAVPSDLGVVVVPYYSSVLFHDDMRIDVSSQTVNWDTRDYGTVQPTLAQIREYHGKTRQGLDFDYKVDILQIQYGKRLGDWAWGANFNYSQAELNHGMGGMRISESHAESYRFRFGGLYQPADKWLVGAIFEYGFAPYRSRMFVPTQWGVVTIRDRGTPHQYVFRPGVSYEYAPMSIVYLDYQFGAFTQGHDDFKEHRVNAGVNHRICDFLYARLGGAVDAAGNLSWTTGLTVNLSEFCSIELGYQYDMFPELRHEFGRSDSIQAVFSLRF